MSCIANGAAGRLSLSDMKMDLSFDQEFICQNPQGMSAGLPTGLGTLRPVAPSIAEVIRTFDHQRGVSRPGLFARARIITSTPRRRRG